MFVYSPQMDSLSELLANRRIPGEQLNKKYEVAQLDCEIHAEPTVEQVIPTYHLAWLENNTHVLA